MDILTKVRSGMRKRWQMGVPALATLVVALALGGQALAAPAKAWQLPPTPCSGASLSVTEASAFVGLNTSDREHWQVLQCRPDGTTPVVLEGVGRWGGLSVSPDGTQVLVQVDRADCGRQVQWYGLGSEGPKLVGTYPGESIRRYAWSADSTRWLGLASRSCGAKADELVVHSRDARERRLRRPGPVAQGQPVEYWLSDTGTSVYALLGDGSLYRDQKVLLRIPVGKNKCLTNRTSRKGSILYALSGTNLYRADAQKGTVTRKSLRSLNRTLHLDVCDPRVLALGPDRVGLIAVGKPISSPQSMYAVSYPGLALQRLTALEKGATAACSATGEGLSAGQGRTWMLWTDDRHGRTVLESR
jgi:hypothetical protein